MLSESRTDRCDRDLYALYASKNRLCTLCGNTTPKKTAYNAYRKTVWLKSRAEKAKNVCSRGCIQTAYKVHTSEHEHIKEGKERILLLLLLYIACSSIFYCPRFTGDHLLLPAIYRRSSSTARTFRHVRTPSRLIARSFRSGCRHVRRSRQTANSCDLYALYASKSFLCALCEDTTPELTAYNAYRNENRRVRRAESTKMYALKDAYRLHTKCIQVSTNT